MIDMHHKHRVLQTKSGTNENRNSKDWRSPIHKILFLNKTAGVHRRYYANKNLTLELAMISELFGVEIVIVNDVSLHSMSLSEQINFVLEYNLLISPCGSLSFLGVFMREGTAKIVIDWWSEQKQKSVHLESYLWEYDTMRKTYYYYVQLSDVIVRVSDEIIKKHHIIKHDVNLNWSDYLLNSKRLIRYIYNALMWIENYHQWSDTFRIRYSQSQSIEDIMEIQEQEHEHEN
jgi:hypothetical protein